jgi:hypothetical protein
MPAKPKDLLGNFLGVNLRRDTLTLADEEMARVVDADLHTMPGVVRLRKGRQPRYDAALPQPIHMIGRHNAMLYQAAGQVLYRGQTPIVVGLDTQLLTTLLAYQPLNDSEVWVFIADGATMQKDNGTVTRVWGIVAPTDAPVVSGGSGTGLTGTYRAQYTYVRLTADKVAHESSPTALSNTVALTNDSLDIPVIASADPQVNRIRVYRTVEGGTLGLFDQMVLNVTATVSSTQPDAALGAAVGLDNDVPRVMAWVTEYQNHVFGVHDAALPNYLWYSKRWQPEAWPSDQFLIIGKPDDMLLAAVPLAGALGVFSRRTKYAVRGNSSSGFVPIEALSTRGTIAPQAVLVTSQGVGFWALDGIFASNFLQADQELTAILSPLFEQEVVNDYAPINLGRAREFGLAEYKQRLYASYVDTTDQSLIAVYSQDTKHWYHYRHPARSLYYDESVDVLLMGGRDGMTYVLETGTTDNGRAISLEAVPPTRYGGDRFQEKFFEYLRLDVRVWGTASATVRIDGEVVKVIPLTGTRTKRLERFAHATKGFTWSVTVAGAVDLYAAMMLYAPLGDGS